MQKSQQVYGVTYSSFSSRLDQAVVISTYTCKWLSIAESFRNCINPSITEIEVYRGEQRGVQHRGGKSEKSQK